MFPKNGRIHLRGFTDSIKRLLGFCTQKRLNRLVKQATNVVCQMNE
jgi:hypothetical protein